MGEKSQLLSLCLYYGVYFFILNLKMLKKTKQQHRYGKHKTTTYEFKFQRYEAEEGQGSVRLLALDST